MERNLKLTISYDGSRYYGWEHQPNTELTIQGKLEGVLSLMTGEAAEVLGAGRTDAGVHARAMVANVHLDTDLSEGEIKAYLNRYLPDDIGVEEAVFASERFHARYNAVGKTYRYTCYYGENKPVFDRKYLYRLDSRPDVETMKKAAERLIGEHDFKAFCSNPKMKKSTVRIVDEINIEERKGYIYFTFHGTGFLQHMVRILTGTLLEIGYHRMKPEMIDELFQNKDRAQAGPTAPAEGLCLMKVDYS